MAFLASLSDFEIASFFLIVNHTTFEWFDLILEESCQSSCIQKLNLGKFREETLTKKKAVAFLQKMLWF